MERNGRGRVRPKESRSPEGGGSSASKKKSGRRGSSQQASGLPTRNNRGPPRAGACLERGGHSKTRGLFDRCQAGTGLFSPQSGSYVLCVLRSSHSVSVGTSTVKALLARYGRLMFTVARPLYAKLVESAVVGGANNWDACFGDYSKGNRRRISNTAAV
ncbi:hypothetical protein L1887_54102 [Cichorium endivia]|nr:hypothetical protein L1887_54102 [Cichorium endivia]